MTDLTKLADALQLKNQNWLELKDREAACIEAARILRSAAGVDVAGLMAMVDEIACAAWTIGTEEPSAGFANKELPRRAALESALRLALAARPALSVWYGSMPESNGRTNWTATLRNGDLHNGFTFARSQYPHRVRYAADEVRHLIGELPKRPSILDYDADEQTPCHLCGGAGEVDGKPCWGLNFEGTVHRAAAAPKGTT